MDVRLLGSLRKERNTTEGRREMEQGKGSKLAVQYLAVVLYLGHVELCCFLCKVTAQLLAKNLKHSQRTF